MPILFSASTLATFTLATLALVAAPGPGQALVLTRTFQGGTRAGLLTVAGLQIGTLGHTLAAALGLSAILATSALAFSTVKLVGAGYLVYLGWRAWRSGHGAGTPAGSPEPRAPQQALREAALTGLLNPKVGIFFLAFLPQFVDPARGHTTLQFLLLGLAFAALSVLGDGTVAIVAGRARHLLPGHAAYARWRDRLTGTVLVALGARLAFARR